MPTKPLPSSATHIARRSLRLAHWKSLAALGAALLALGGMARAANVDACAAISTDTTWTTGNVYRISNCSPAIAAGVTLTIEPGAVVKFGGNASALIVNGSLQAIGSASQKVVFTSLADDSRGGDSNEDGSATAAAAGDWYGLLFRPGSSGRIEHFFLGHAGSGVFNSPAGLWNRAQLDVDQAAVELHDGEIALGKRKGVYLNGDGITPVLQRLTIRDNVREDGNTSYGAIGYAIYQTTPNMQPSYADLSLSGNELDAVLIYQWNIDLTQDLLLAGAPFRADCGYTVCELKVPAGRTLTIAPGTQIDFSDPWGSGAPFSIAVSEGGALIAEGTSTQPISLYSSRAAAGDGDAHYWNGIWAKAGSRLRLAHCAIGHTRNGNFGMGAVDISTADAQLSHCRLHDGLGYGLYVMAPQSSSVALAFADLEISDNASHGVYLNTRYGSRLNLELTRVDVLRNGLAGVYGDTYDSTQGPISLALRDSSISGNGRLGTLGTQQQTAGLYLAEHNTSPQLENLTLNDNRGAAVYWYCNGSISANNLSASGNERDRIVVPGCEVAGGRQWELADAGIGVEVDANISVKANAFLNLRPGTTLRFAASRSLSVSGTLFGLGTALQPVRLLGIDELPGSWRGVKNTTTGSVFLSQCEIAYAGAPGGANYDSGLYLSYYASSAVVQNCDIHDNYRGIISSLPGAVIRNNSLRDNVEFGVVHGGYMSESVDARDNWWGIASGPFHATLNPAGEGNAVGDRVLFDPWLQAPPEDQPLAADTVIVATGSPDFVSPGQTVDYAVQYLNLRSEAVQNALVVMQLPVAAEFISATHGGVYWASRHQVVWRPGNVPAGAMGSLSATTRLAWGLPRGYSDGSLTLFSGDNYQTELHSAEDRAAYLALDPDALDSYGMIDPAVYASERGAVPALEALHSTALGDGFRFIQAAHVQSVDGLTATLGTYIHPTTQHARLLLRQGSKAAAIDVTRDAFSVYDASGGSRISLDTGQQTDWGDWAAPAASKAGDCTYESCKFKCRSETLGLAYLGRKVGRIAAWTALGLFSGGTTTIGAAYEVGDLAVTAVQAIWNCDNECFADPNAHCCTTGQVKWSGGFAMELLTMCFKSTCSAAGTWVPSGSQTCVTGTRCVASVDGKGCTECDESTKSALLPLPPLPAPLPPKAAAPLEEDCAGNAKLTAGGRKPRCKDLKLFVAKDPNDITGPNGDVLPGQSVDYVIRFENEGEGRAYGVYVVNALPQELDESTLVIGNGGWYVPASRELVWVVGELGPKGDPDSEGSLSYTVNVRSGLASSTPIANQAVVYFPSVPETTPTNTWVNLVQPLAAIPQTLDTAYETPLAITLDGREVSNLPLTFAVDQAPLRGELSGTPPNLSYTPAANTVGEDSFSFTVSNGSSESRPAQVLLRIASSGDGNAPQILSSFPADGATAVEVVSVPLFSDPLGPVYSPVIVVAVSEPLDPDSVTAQRVTLSGPGGALSASVSFDAGTQRIVLVPRQPLAGETMHTLQLHAGITDLAGNPLSPVTLAFTTAEAPQPPSPLIFENGFEAD
jgi:hypothetical protein